METPILAKNRDFPEKPQKVGFSWSRSPARAGFYINPSRRGPAVPGGVPGPREGRIGQGASRRPFSGPPGTPGPRDRPGEPRGPGARGWCKTPPAPGSGTPGPGPEGPPGPPPGGPLGAGVPNPRIRVPGTGSGRPPRTGSGKPPGSSQGLWETPPP